MPKEPDEIDVLEAEARLAAMLRERLEPIMKDIRTKLPKGAEFLLAVNLKLTGIMSVDTVTIATDREVFVTPMRDWADKVEREAKEG